MSNFRRHLMGVIATQRQYIEGYCQPGTASYTIHIRQYADEGTSDMTRFYTVTPDANGYWRWYVPQGKTIKSLASAFSMSSVNDSNALVSIDLSHIAPVTSFYATFGQFTSPQCYACTNLKSVKGMRTVSDNSLDQNCFNSTFYNCSSLEYVEVRGWKNTARATTVLDCFRNCPDLTTLDGQDEWELRLATGSRFVDGCTNLEELDMANFVGGSSTTTMFRNCEKLKRINFGNVTFTVTSLTYMFYHCYELEEIDLSVFTGSTPTIFSNTFNSCQKVEEIDLSPLGNCSVTTMAGTFNGCTNLKSVYGLNKISVSSCTTFASMCFQCRNLEDFDIHTWVCSENDVSFASMMRECFAMKINASTVPDFSGATASRIDYMYASGSLSVQQQWEADTGRTAWADFTHISIPTIPEGSNSNNFTSYQYRATTVTSCGDISNAISLSYSPLDLQSAILVLQHLQDVTGYGGKTLSFNTTTRALIAADATAMSLVQNARDNLGWTITI